MWLSRGDGLSSRPGQNQRGFRGAVQVPTSLKFLNVAVLLNGQGPGYGCGGLANYGIYVDINYQVLDQNKNSIQSARMTPHENGKGFGGKSYDTNIGPVDGFPTSSATTASDGTFHDVPFGGCANGAFSAFTATQNITMIMSNGSTSPVVRSQNWTLTGKTAGHRTLKNSITSPGSGSDISATVSRALRSRFADPGLLRVDQHSEGPFCKAQWTPWLLSWG
jgi:hypothetical protein